MKLIISHFTRYTYNEAVFFEPHYLRFQPRQGPFIKLNSFNIKVKPRQQGMSTLLDAENNTINFYWFSGLHSQMEINTEAEVELQSFNPFEFLIHPPDHTSFPFQYNNEFLPYLQPSLQHVRLNRDLKEFATRIARQADHQTISFLSSLTNAIHKEISLMSREKDPPLAPEKTFLDKRGSCRDLAWLQIQLLRHKGFATRFVSGYLFLDSETPEFELHAWLEVYLPGAGWIGLDPSHGVFADQNYIAVAASSNYKHTMPVTGSVRGDAEASLHTELNIKRKD